MQAIKYIVYHTSPVYIDVFVPHVKDFAIHVLTRKTQCIIKQLLTIEIEFEIRDENSQPFSIRKICWLTPKWRKKILNHL